jgi:metal-dependent amidase/aminoacylase/carboxypeptidase family protein
MKAMEAKLVNVAKKIATIFQLECKTSWTQSFQANENSIEAVNYIKKVVNSNNFELLERNSIYMGGFWTFHTALFRSHVWLRFRN